MLVSCDVETYPNVPRPIIVLVIKRLITPEERYPRVPRPTLVLVNALSNERELTYPDDPKPVTVLGKKNWAELGYKEAITCAVENSSPDRVLI